MKYRVKILSHDKTITARKGEVLADRIQQAGINLNQYCQKRGLCGKCFIKIKEGLLSPPEKREKFLLESKRLAKNYRLACLYRVKSDLGIEIPEESILQETFVLTTGAQIPVTLAPAARKFHLQLEKPKISVPLAITELLNSRFRDKELAFPLSLLKELPGAVEQSKFQITVVVYNDEQILNVEPKNTLSKSYGLAVDLGTTTVVVELVDLNTGKSLDVLTAANSQMKFGSDVISRISYAYSNPKNLDKLRDSILETLNLLIGQILKKNRIHSSYVYEIVVAGNTTMNHLLLGIPVKSLAVAPFNPVFTRLLGLSMENLGLKVNSFGRAYIAPNIKSFVGGDISAGLIASDLINRKGNYLFLDIGTNGEILLKKKDRFVVTSTAAGPAFEGMNISCGILASPGAIYRVEYKKELEISTIGNKPATGICGTGLIDLIALWLEQGKISPRGKIVNETKEIPLTKNIHVNQKDVREIQLAVAAVKTGIRMILEEYHLKKQELDGIFVAGAFGNYLNIQNSIRIGLLPEIDEEKCVFIGNASLAGARALLLSLPEREKIDSLVNKIQYLSLANNPLFQKYFIESLEFNKY
ncbi:MAG: DUF4445 domain-containing protein [Candidatus Aminicenantes bacterium]|nr:DUF4445 domain-containing protein [Candidatus Aminicenantes bacterium]